MRQSYLKDKQVTSDGSAVLKISDDPVKPGYVLVVRNLCGNHDNIANTETVLFRITNGAELVNIQEKLAAAAGVFVTWSGRVVVPEGWYVEGYYAAAANTEVMRLDIVGELIDLKTYRGAQEG